MLKIKFPLMLGIAVALTACGSQQDQAKAAAANSSGKVCANINMNKLVGFDEQQDTPQCRPIKDYNVVAFKCEIVGQAFGIKQDAVHIQNEQHSIFAYDSDKDCREGLAARDANVN